MASRTLLQLARDAGWFGESSPETPGKFVPLAEVELGDAAKWLQWLRNLVHPGLFVRDMPEKLEVNETAFQNAYEVLDAAFAVAFDVDDVS